MSCDACHGKGLVRVNWSDAPEDYAVCLCDTGQRMRTDCNKGGTTYPLWRLWCAREQIDPERIVMLEDVLSVDELSARGLTKDGPVVDRAGALMAEGRRKR